MTTFDHELDLPEWVKEFKKEYNPCDDAVSFIKYFCDPDAAWQRLLHEAQNHQFPKVRAEMADWIDWLLTALRYDEFCRGEEGKLLRVIPDDRAGELFSRHYDPVPVSDVAREIPRFPL